MRMMASLVVLTACGGKVSDPAETHDSGGPTFWADALPIIGENCQQCHNSDAPMGGAFPLETYAQISSLAEILMPKMTVEGDTDEPFFMPPFNAKDSEECSTWLPFRGTYHVTEEQLDTFAAWINAGKPEGEPSSAGSYSVPASTHLSGELHTLTFKGPHTVPPPAEDQWDSFRCFALQVGSGGIEMQTNTWVDAFEFTPGNSEVAHHMLLYTVPDLAHHVDSGLVQDPDTNSWDCSGGVNRTDGSYSLGGIGLIWGWVPGALPLELTDSMGMRVPAGTGLVVQMHYNTLGSSTGETITDLSSLKARTLNEVPLREAKVRLFGVAGEGQSDKVEDPPFFVPAGATDHVESYIEVMSDAMTQDVRIWGLTPHMHLSGTDLKMTRTGTDGVEDCLTHVPRWDYNWQQMYIYDGSWEELPRLKAGDTLRVRCTMDNSDDNPFLQKYLGGHVPEGIVLGDGTDQEMCLVGLGIACDGLCDL